MKPTTILFAALLQLTVSANAQSQQTVKVLEYCPAPGQFINTLPAIDAAMSAEERLKACEEQIEDGNLVCLGAAGGYITFGFDEPIKNLRGSDLRILGNAFYSQNDPVYGASTIGGSVEPGIVFAGVGTSPETATWYELAGSEYYTTKRHNFSITYHKPTAEKGDHEKSYSVFDNYIRFTATWDDADGTKRDTTGYLMKNVFHPQTYWPVWEDKEEMTFSGARLPNNAINYGGDEYDTENAQLWVTYRYAADSYGYVDAAPNDDQRYTTFDLDWAVDKNGNPVKLTHADFIRIQTGVLQHCGWTGETSTEVSSVINLHLVEGYDADPIIITPRPRPTAIDAINASAAKETARYNISGQRISKPQHGVNIVKYEDGSVRKIIIK